jgi:putative ABC transport system permease protein
MDRLRQDLRYALRMAAKRPGFTATALATLAIGIGATSALFSVVNGILLRPLPFPDPEQLALLWSPDVRRGPASRGALSYPDFLDHRQQTTSFEDLAAVRPVGYTLVTPAGAERVEGARASAGFFEILRVTPALGRTFTRDEDRRGGPRVTILSYSLWRTRFGGDPAIVGRPLTLDGQSYTVIGVLPRGFVFPYKLEEAAIWTPLSLDDEESLKERGMHSLAALGRLRPGVSLAQARTDAATVAARLAKQYPDSNTGREGTVAPLHDEVVGRTRDGLLLLLGAVACVLLVACANVANLLLARGTEREREVAIRGALGAGRRRLARQLLTESVLLGVAGGVLGLALAYWGVQALVALAPRDLPRLDEVRLDFRVALFTFGAALVTGLLFGAAPAWRASRPDMVRALAEGGRGGGAAGGPGRHRLRDALIVGEVALSLVLLAGAGLLLRSLDKVLRVDPGFDPEQVLTAQVSLSETRYATPEQTADFYRALVARLGALPGVSAAGTVAPLPFVDQIFMTSIHDAAKPEPPPAEQQVANYKAATPGYFAALHIPLRSGRLFTDADLRGRPGVVILGESLARRTFPGQDAVGRHVKFGVSVEETDEEATWEVVGVVGDTSLNRLDTKVEPVFYVSGWQQPWPWMSVAVRSSQDATAWAEAVRREVRALDPDVAVHRVRSLPDLVSDSVAQRRFQSALLIAFAVAGLTLAAVGLYGVMTYSVTLRTREIGIRMALGAERRRVLGGVLRQGFGLVAVGLAAGLAAALGLARLITGLLYGVSASDPPAFGGAAALLVVTALLASYLPARRATRVDPMGALRAE